jgi:hypothetical protein
MFLLVGRASACRASLALLDARVDCCPRLLAWSSPLGWVWVLVRARRDGALALFDLCCLLSTV